MDVIQPRTLRPALALLAGIAEFGLGYVYVGRLRSGIAAFAAMYGALAFFTWTRFITLSPLILWSAYIVIAVLILIVLIHPVVIAAQKPQVSTESYNRWWFYLLWVVVGTALVLAVGTHRAALFGYDLFRVPSASMSPTVESGDFILSDSWRYRNGGQPKIGEIVILQRPQSPGVSYIKRVVAVAGDTIEIREGILFRNGQMVYEPYIHERSLYDGHARTVSPLKLAPDSIYVLGDYRDNSMDSRQWGPFATSALRGRVQYIWLSAQDGHVHLKRKWLAPPH
jgi:signal peptidase I